MTEYHSIQQTLGIAALLHSPAEPSEIHHSGQIKKDQPQKGLHLRVRGTRGQPPLKGRTAGPLAAARRTTSSEKEPAAETSAAATD
jgi:hypothetical protein